MVVSIVRRSLFSFVLAVAVTFLPAAAAAAAGPVWATGTAVPLPAGSATAAGTQNATLQALTCFSYGNCEGVGSYQDSANDTQLMAVSEAKGTSAGAVELTLPGNAFASPSFSPTLTSIACAAQGACVAVGYYQIDSSGDELPVIYGQSGGVWGAGSGITLPGGAATVQGGSVPWFSQLSSVSCTSYGNCVAVGQYSDASGDVHAMAVTEVGGHWGSATEIVDPPNSSRQNSSLSGVSCTSPGNCEAVGAVNTATDGQQAMVASESGGVWGQASEIVQPSNATTNLTYVTAYLSGVSCVSLGSCEAVGSYADVGSQNGEDLQPMAVTEANGTWQQATEVTLPAGANTAGDQYAGLDTVSCVSPGNCEAGGGYLSSAGDQLGLLADESDGVWSQAIDVVLPPDAAASPNAQSYISSVTCSALNSCDAAGQYEANSGSSQALFLAGAPTLSLAGRMLPDATAGDAYSASLSATGGTGNYTWSLTSGSLPAGLSLNSSTGVISGTATNQTSSTFTVGISDNGPPAQTASASFSITVTTPPPGRPTLASVHLKHRKLETTLSCAGTTVQTCDGTVILTVSERWRGRELVGVAASDHPKPHSRTVVLAKASFAIHGESSKTVTIGLNAAGRHLLAQHRRLKARVTVEPTGNSSTPLTRIVLLN